VDEEASNDQDTRYVAKTSQCIPMHHDSANHHEYEQLLKAGKVSDIDQRHDDITCTVVNLDKCTISPDHWMLDDDYEHTVARPGGRTHP
jgi:hypothetical protein